MDSNFYEVIKQAFEKNKKFYTIFGSSIVETKVVGLSGDYVMLMIRHGEQNLKIHCHYTNVQVVSKS